MRSFKIYYKDSRDKLDIELVKKVTISKPTGNIGQDAKSALEIFLANFGGMKRNTIIKIQEINKMGQDIGLPIIPNEDSTIVPTKR